MSSPRARRPTGAAPAIRGSRVRSAVGNRLSGATKNPSDLKQEIKLLQEQNKHLQAENTDLKVRLRALRKAAASTTRVVKAPTQFLEPSLRPPSGVVSLPPISSAAKNPTQSLISPATDSGSVENLKEEISRLEARLAHTADKHSLEIDGLKNQLSDKISKAMELNADINRLQSFCRQLQEDGKNKVLGMLSMCACVFACKSIPIQKYAMWYYHRKLPPSQAGSDADKDTIATLEQRIQELESDLMNAQQAAASCAHIVKVKEKQVTDAVCEIEVAKSAARVSAKVAEDATASAHKITLELEDQRAAYELRESEMRKVLDTMKAAWKKREADWQEYDKKRNEQWKADAAKWLTEANSKLHDLKNGASLLHDVSLRISSKNSSSADKQGGVDDDCTYDEPPYP
eukprot:m.542050 g.542050  ORF g.542050 m.542050 type:complete len:402 (-) comp22114_c0_seq8:273-1478(-)